MIQFNKFINYFILYKGKNISTENFPFKVNQPIKYFPYSSNFIELDNKNTFMSNDEDNAYKIAAGLGNIPQKPDLNKSNPTFFFSNFMSNSPQVY